MPSTTPQQEPSTVPPPRVETFLARYPRKLKVTVFLVGLAVLLLPLFLRNPLSLPQALITKSHQPANIAQGVESASSLAAPSTSGGAQDQAKFDTHAEALNGQDDRTLKMPPAPDPSITEDTAEGSLPRVNEDGRKPWQVYARPFNTADKRPRIAIIVTDLGLSRVETDTAISRLPANVTLAFDAQSSIVGSWMGRARQDGHETLLELSMEPFDYPRSDPGSNSMLTSLPNADNIQRLLGALRQGTGYVGVTTLSGSRFTTDPDKLSSILEIILTRGLMVFDARVAPHSAVSDMAHNMRIPSAAATGRLDQNLSPEAIDAALYQLEQTARVTGRAVGITAPLPVVIDRLQVWLKDLPKRGIALAPVSAMVQ